MNRFFAVLQADVMQGLRSRLMQVFAGACLLGGSVLLVVAPGPETLAVVLIQVLLFFGSLFAFLVGWGSGQQARQQGAFLFAQPVGAGELIVGKLTGTGSWALVLLVLLMGPALLGAGAGDTVTLSAGTPATGAPDAVTLSAVLLGTILPLLGLTVGFLLVCMLAGLMIGLLASPVPGLLGVLMAWAMTVGGWELLLLALSGTAWMQSAPWIFVTLLLANPAGAYRVAAMIGLDTIPFDTQGLETGRWVFEHITVVALGIFAVWIAALLWFGVVRVGRAEY